MASISIYDFSYDSCKLKLTDLAASGIEYDRSVLWYVNDTDYNNVWTSGYVYLEPNIREGAIVTVTGLSTATHYYVDCYVYRTDTGEMIWSSENTEFVTTEAPEFYITSLEVEQIEAGEKKAIVSWNGYNLVGGTYSVKARQIDSQYVYTKASGDITSSSISVEISFDNFDTYEVWLVVEKYGTSAPIETVEVDIVDIVVIDPISSCSIFQYSDSEGYYNEGRIYIIFKSGYPPSDVEVILYDNTTGITYEPELYSSSINSIGQYSCRYSFAPIDTYGTHEFTLSYTYNGKTWKRNISATFTEPTVNVELWDWEEGKGSDRDTAYQAIINNGIIEDFKYTVWNELCAKVLEALNAYGLEWDNTFAVYEDTLMTDTEEGKKLYAWRFNSLRKNVGNQYSTGIEDKITGDKVKGEYFITIADALNNFISTKINI